MVDVPDINVGDIETKGYKKATIISGSFILIYYAVN